MKNNKEDQQMAQNKNNPFGVLGLVQSMFGPTSKSPRLTGAPLSPARQASVEKAAAASAAKRKGKKTLGGLR